MSNELSFANIPYRILSIKSILKNIEPKDNIYKTKSAILKQIQKIHKSLQTKRTLPSPQRYSF
jgi:hypothetical protein